MIYGYIRVSTDKQTTENQKFEIENFAAANGIVIDEWIVETISSTKELRRRKFGKLMSKIKKDDLIITSELSRIGRNLMQIMSILNILLDRGVKVWTIKDNYRLGDDIPSKVLAFAFGLSAEIERSLISQRTTEALARLRAEGRKLGRPLGSKNKTPKLSGKENQIQYMISMGFSRSAIARKLRVHRMTVESFIVSKNLKFCPKYTIM